MEFSNIGAFFPLSLQKRQSLGSQQHQSIPYLGIKTLSFPASIPFPISLPVFYTRKGCRLPFDQGSLVTLSPSQISSFTQSAPTAVTVASLSLPHLTFNYTLLGILFIRLLKSPSNPLVFLYLLLVYVFFSKNQKYFLKSFPQISS